MGEADRLLAVVGLADDVEQAGRHEPLAHELPDLAGVVDKDDGRPRPACGTVHASHVPLLRTFMLPEDCLGDPIVVRCWGLTC